MATSDIVSLAADNGYHQECTTEAILAVVAARKTDEATASGGPAKNSGVGEVMLYIVYI